MNPYSALSDIDYYATQKEQCDECREWTARTDLIDVFDDDTLLLCPFCAEDLTD